MFPCNRVCLLVLIGREGLKASSSLRLIKGLLEDVGRLIGGLLILLAWRNLCVGRRCCCTGRCWEPKGREKWLAPVGTALLRLPKIKFSNVLNKLLPADDEVGGRLGPPPNIDGGRLPLPPRPLPKVEAKVWGMEDTGDSPVIALTRVSRPGISSVFSDMASHLYVWGKNRNDYKIWVLNASHFLGMKIQ